MEHVPKTELKGKEIETESSLSEEIFSKQKYYVLGKHEGLPTSALFDSDEQEELAKLQMTTENIKCNLAKVEAIKKYWGDKVCTNVYVCMYSM